MEVTIKGTEKEIADFVVLLQSQQLVRKPYSENFTVGVSTTASCSVQQCKTPTHPYRTFSLGNSKK